MSAAGAAGGSAGALDPPSRTCGGALGLTEPCSGRVMRSVKTVPSAS